MEEVILKMLIVHDNRLPEEYISALKGKLPSCRMLPFSGMPSAGSVSVYRSIYSHPDIYFFQVDANTIIHSPSVARTVLRELSGQGVSLIKGERSPQGHYPETAAYNAVRVGSLVFHNMGYTDNAIRRVVYEKGLSFFSVTQGYTRCSVVPVGSDALITSDEGIAKTARLADIKTLLISPGYVTLPGEKYGFIGGASGTGPSGEVIFLGSLEGHPEHGEICDFLRQCDTKWIELQGLSLYDAGTLMVFG